MASSPIHTMMYFDWKPWVLAMVPWLGGCGDAEVDAQVNAEALDTLIAEADERTVYHQIDIALATPMPSGRVGLYRFMVGEVEPLETRTFDHPNPKLHLGYQAPSSVMESAVLLHVTGYGLTEHSPEEYVCFAPVVHATSRHNLDVQCGLASTVAYYFSAKRVGKAGRHAFHDIQARLGLWRAIMGAPDNDVHGFYVSVFGTLQRGLVSMGAERFTPERHSIRPVMETIVARFVDRFQRNGEVTARELVTIANQVTDHSLPLERIIRYRSVFNQVAHIAEVEMENTGGSLTRRGRQLELLSMSTELRRFFLRGAAYEMSDYRTHIVQNVRHERTRDALSVQWDPIGHMYGYNIYLNSQHVGYSRVPGIELSADARGTVTVKAVGYAGEFDGVHHELSGPTQVATLR